MNPKKAMILAAGFGTRMEEYTKNLPKPLLPVAGIPLITYTLFLLYVHQVESVVVNVHYQKDKIKDYLKDFPYFSIFFSEEEEILGTAGGISFAISNHLLSDYFLIINPDTIFFPDFNPFEDIAILKNFFIDHLLYIQKKDQKHKKEKGFIIKKDMDHYYHLNFTNQENISNEEYFYTGLSIFHESFFYYYRNNFNRHFSTTEIYKKELSELLQYPINAKIYSGIRIDCGTKKDYEDLNNIYHSPLEIIPEKLHKKWKEFIQGWDI
ncbi:MAG: nucleoside-diphosphate-sugar pyrophosphorylase [Leptospiraceae bacterium]|nr:MAG: nucleoside-diphosphate-sugar pyrophosphorylase [Leptospiraceae bacterium]